MEEMEENNMEEKIYHMGIPHCPYCHAIGFDIDKTKIETSTTNNEILDAVGKTGAYLSKLPVEDAFLKGLLKILGLAVPSTAKNMKKEVVIQYHCRKCKRYFRVASVNY